mmetsp:Transcript_11475/g.33602  ORF Transcript_11475/g.33602 Transcript_11475/m.33602 type:complete len:217 (-) Transcript_11475:15-665(-)
MDRRGLQAGGRGEAPAAGRGAPRPGARAGTSPAPGGELVPRRGLLRRRLRAGGACAAACGGRGAARGARGIRARLAPQRLAGRGQLLCHRCLRAEAMRRRGAHFAVGALPAGPQPRARVGGRLRRPWPRAARGVPLAPSACPAAAAALGRRRVPDALCSPAPTPPVVGTGLQGGRQAEASRDAGRLGHATAGPATGGLQVLLLVPRRGLGGPWWRV